MDLHITPSLTAKVHIFSAISSPCADSTNKTKKKEDGYYFNCDAPKPCPFAKLVLRELTEIGNDTDEHICAWDKRKYHEISMVTNICIDHIAEYNRSYFVDCTANSITYSVYTDAECKIKSSEDDQFVIEEGCDDVFDIDSYIQIAECEDANYEETSGGEDHYLAVIFTIFAAVIVVILVVLIAAKFLRRKTVSQINSVNVDAQPLSVDFQSIGDAEPESQQIISTQGQDIHPIPIAGNGYL